MINIRFNSISSKITLSIVTIIIFFGTLSAVSTYYLTKQNLIKVKQEDILNAISIQSDETGLAFQQSSSLVTAIAGHPRVVSFMGKSQKSDTDQVDLDSLYLETYNLDQAYSAIYLVDKDGLTLASTDASFIGKNYAFRGYFKEAIKGDSYVDVSIGVTSGQMGYYFSHPVTSSDGSILGVAVVKQKPEVIHETVSDRIVHGSNMMLVDRYGVVVFSNDPDKVFHSLAPLSEETMKTVIDEERYGGKQIDGLDYGEVAQSLVPGIEPKSFMVHDEHDGEEEMLSLAQIGKLPFYLVNELELEEATGRARDQSLTMSAFVFVAALSATVAISFLVNRLLAPLSHLTTQANEIAKGKVYKAVKIKSEDEVGQLSSAFNNMVSQLIAVNQDIESKVKERTAQLEKLNRSMVGRELKMVELKKEIESYKKEGSDEN